MGNMDSRTNATRRADARRARAVALAGGGTPFAVAVSALLLRREPEEDRCDADDYERQPIVRALVGEPEDPRRGSQKRAGDHVDQVVNGHRRDLPEAELVVREQAVDDEPNAEHDGDGRRGRVTGELEDPRCGHQDRPDDVIKGRVPAGGDETHRVTLLSSGMTGHDLFAVDAAAVQLLLNRALGSPSSGRAAVPGGSRARVRVILE